MTFDEFYSAYEKTLAEFPESPFLIHFRIATSGPADKTNTHPFLVGGGALIHNGVLFSPPTGTKRSDTNIFAEWMTRRLTDKDAWVLNKEKVEELIGKWNKIAVLFKDGTIVICNEKEGNWENNVWYSNTYSYSQGSGWMGVSRPTLALGYHQSRSIN